MVSLLTPFSAAIRSQVLVLSIKFAFILLELRLGFAFGVCLQRGKHCCLIELVTEMFRPDELCPSGRQIAEPLTAFLDGNAVLLHELVREIFKAGGTVQHRRNLFP